MVALIASNRNRQTSVSIKSTVSLHAAKFCVSTRKSCSDSDPLSGKMPADSARFPTVWQLLCAKTILSSCLAWMSSAAQFDPWYACCTHQTTELLLVQLWCSCNAFLAGASQTFFGP